MSAEKFFQPGFLLALTLGSGALLTPCLAYADDYTDLLDILRAKGSLTKGEYSTLLSKHLHHARPTARALDDDSAPAPRRIHTVSARSAHGRSSRYTADDMVAPADSQSAALMQARDAATRAEASAQAAQQALLSTRSELNNGGIVHADPYVAGKGVTLHAGQIAINLSGFVNGFYTFNSPGGGTAVAGGLANGSSGFDSSSVRNGLLPAGIIVKLSTHQAGLDLQAVFGAYPGLNNANPGAFNANTGGSPVGLGTAGLDFRQIYITFGNQDIGTFKVGRDLALFGSDAILNDATLLSVGSTGSNIAPANTSLGRIGVGYVYADWIPQISYATPKWKGLQGNIGVFTPLDEFNYADVTGAAAGLNTAYSATNTQHSSPMIQGKLSYDFAINKLVGHIWSSFLIQHQQNLKGGNIAANAKRGVMTEAGDIGAKLTYGPFEGVAYYYYGSGLGTTGLFFDGVSSSGHKRNSEGYYVQGAWKIIPKLKLVGSYGVSNLYQAPGEVSPFLVRRNQSEVGALYYNWTNWLTLMAEYAHTNASAHGPDHNKDNTVSAGAAIFF
ncbi:porin [Kozakia baliensis]|uniref:porin n=1 Tax=Kozakia baliensis TaxID=153496 RepID=UPI00345BDA80